MTMVWDIELPATEKLVMLALADCANDEGECWPSIATLMRKTGVSERTVQRATKAIEEGGHMSRHEVVGRGTRYFLHPRHSDTPVAKSPPPQRREPPPQRHPTPVTVTPKPSENHQEPSLRETARVQRDDCKIVFVRWNEMADQAGVPSCQKITEARRKSCCARLKDDGLDAILRAIARIPASPFLLGETGKWSGATIDFLLRPDTVTKILEGKYDDRPERPNHQSVSQSAGSRGERRNPLLDMLAQAEAESRAERDQEDDRGTWPPLRAIGEG